MNATQLKLFAQYIKNCFSNPPPPPLPTKKKDKRYKGLDERGVISVVGHLAALTRSHLIVNHPLVLTKEQTAETMDSSPKTNGLRHYPRQ